jgi:hypothetical protein
MLQPGVATKSPDPAPKKRDETVPGNVPTAKNETSKTQNQAGPSSDGASSISDSLRRLDLYGSRKSLDSDNTESRTPVHGFEKSGLPAGYSPDQVDVALNTHLNKNQGKAYSSELGTKREGYRPSATRYATDTETPVLIWREIPIVDDDTEPDKGAVTSHVHSPRQAGVNGPVAASRRDEYAGVFTVAVMVCRCVYCHNHENLF